MMFFDIAFKVSLGLERGGSALLSPSCRRLVREVPVKVSLGFPDFLGHYNFQILQIVWISNVADKD